MMQQLPQLRMLWRDGSGSTAEVKVTINSLLPVATIESAATGLVAALSDLTDAAFVSQEIVYNVVPSSYVELSGDTSILETGVFIFQHSGDGPIALVEVHSINPDLLVTVGPGAGVLIDMADARVVAFVGELDSAGATDPFAFVLGPLVASYRQSRA